MFRNLSAFWQRRSLRFWLATGMLMTFCPILISALIGFFFYGQRIIDPLIEVTSKQRYILQPLQDIQLTLWDVSNSVTDYAMEGDARFVDEYRREAANIEAGFENLLSAAKGHDVVERDVLLGRNDWRKVTELSDAVLSGPTLKGQIEFGKGIEAFTAGTDQLGHSLGNVFEDVRAETEQMHSLALTNVTNYERLAITGFLISIFLAILGVALINRSLVASLDRLAIGALRVAAGEREHQIKVKIPVELVSVAQAFNQMTNQILEQEKALEDAARTDGLTGLFNRREMDRLLLEEIQRGERFENRVSLIIGDIDHFKRFNDTHGHQAGDEALRVVAKTLKEGLREVDRVCRFGGEEFVVILPKCNAEDARIAAERIRQKVEMLNIHLENGQVTQATISLGTATYPDNATTPEKLLKEADAALYESKEQGRNRVTSAIRKGRGNLNSNTGDV